MTTRHAIPDAALEADIAILGKKGRGKTYTAKGCVERLLDMGRRVVVLDPLSTWWGLKAGPNGYAIPVLGGPHGDLPLRDRDGAALGQHLATSNGSAVLDLGAMRKAELIRFATAFLEELYTANRAPLWLVLEEADVFAPQQPMADTARLLGEVDRIARRGRQFGFRLISLTQRPARLAKDVLTQLSTLIVLGITSPQDRAAVQAWVEGNADRDQAKAVVDSLASLRIGEGWVWAPDLSLLEQITFPPIRTLDTSATPQAGAPVPVAQLRTDFDLESLRNALAAAAPELTSAETRAPAPRASVVDEQAAEQRGYERGRAEGLAEGRRQAREALDGISAALTRAAESLNIIEPLPTPGRPELAKCAASRRVTPAPPAPQTRPTLAIQRPADLNSAGRKMLGVLDTNPPVRRSWQQVATLAGLRARGGHFNAGKKGLIDAGLVTLDGALVVIAAPSQGAAPPHHDPAALIATWCAVLSGVAPRILRALFESSAPGWTKAEIADALGVQPRGGHWNAGWKELRENGLVVIEGERVRLAPLFRSDRGEVEPT